MIDNNRYCTLEFPVEVNTVLHGFAGYFETVLYQDITLSECLELQMAGYGGTWPGSLSPLDSCEFQDSVNGALWVFIPMTTRHPHLASSRSQNWVFYVCPHRYPSRDSLSWNVLLVSNPLPY